MFDKTPPNSESIRLSKLMAQRGLCSRREADSYIAKGWVKVDGVVVNELGSRVLPHQKSNCNGPPKKHKPRA